MKFCHSCSESEKTKSLNSIDPKSMHRTEGRACSGVLLLNKNILDNCRRPGQILFDPRRFGSTLLTSNEISVSLNYIPHNKNKIFFIRIPLILSVAVMYFTKFTTNNLYNYKNYFTWRLYNQNTATSYSS